MSTRQGRVRRPRQGRAYPPAAVRRGGPPGRDLAGRGPASLWDLPQRDLVVVLYQMIESGTGAAAYYADMMQAVLTLAVMAPCGQQVAHARDAGNTASAPPAGWSLSTPAWPSSRSRPTWTTARYWRRSRPTRAAT